MSNETTGQRLRAARKAAGLTAAEMGRRAAEYLERPRPISASAVRNQENGTNGIPIVVLDAYANVLDVPVGRLLLGDDYDTRETPEAEAYHQISKAMGIDEGSDAGVWETDLDQIEIDVLGSVTANFQEMMMRRDDAPISVYVDVPSYWGTELFARSVFDGSLHPKYPQGTILIFAPVEATGVREGDHVLFAAVHEGAAYEAVREVRRSTAAARGATLYDIGDPDAEPIAWFIPGILSRLYPVGIVVAALTLISPNARGRPIPMPKGLKDSIKEMERARTATEEHKSRDAADAERLSRLRKKWTADSATNVGATDDRNSVDAD